MSAKRQRVLTVVEEGEDFERKFWFQKILMYFIEMFKDVPCIDMRNTITVGTFLHVLNGSADMIMQGYGKMMTKRFREFVQIHEFCVQRMPTKDLGVLNSLKEHFEYTPTLEIVKTIVPALLQKLLLVNPTPIRESICADILLMVPRESFNNFLTNYCVGGPVSMDLRTLIVHIKKFFSMPDFINIREYVKEHVCYVFQDAEIDDDSFMLYGVKMKEEYAYTQVQVQLINANKTISLYIIPELTIPPPLKTYVYCDNSRPMSIYQHAPDIEASPEYRVVSVWLAGLPEQQIQERFITPAKKYLSVQFSL